MGRVVSGSSSVSSPRNCPSHHFVPAGTSDVTHSNLGGPSSSDHMQRLRRRRFSRVNARCSKYAVYQAGAGSQWFEHVMRTNGHCASTKTTLLCWRPAWASAGKKRSGRVRHQSTCPFVRAAIPAANSAAAAPLNEIEWSQRMRTRLTDRQMTFFLLIAKPRQY